MILIVTANSRLGNATAQQLLQDGRSLRGLVRSQEKGADLAQLGAEIIEIGGPGNYTNNQVAHLYAQAIGNEVKIGNVPRPVVRILSAVMWPFQPGLSQVMGWAWHEDSHDNSFDPGPTLQKYPLELTPLEAFVAEQVGGDMEPVASGK